MIYRCLNCGGALEFDTRTNKMTCNMCCSFFSMEMVTSQTEEEKQQMEELDEKMDEEMRLYALKRYLLNIQIAWYRVHKYLPREKEVLYQLKKEWKKKVQERKRWQMRGV